MALILITIISLYPRLKTGFTTNDDSEIALAALQGQTFQQATSTALAQGRISEFFLILELAIPYLVQNPIYYYSIALAAILSNIISFYILMRRVFGSERIALFITGLASAFLQYNWQHGLLTSYPFAYCFALTCFIWSIIFYYRWLQGRHPVAAILTGILFFLALLVSEGFAPYFVVFLGLGICKASSSGRWRATLWNTSKAFLPIGISLGLYVSIWMAFGKMHPGTYEGVHLDLRSLTGIAKVLWQFSVSTLPSYFYWRDPTAMAVTFDGLSAPVWGITGLIKGLRVEWIVKGTILLFFCAWLLRRQRRIGGGFFASAFAAGIACVIAPICLQATTVKYQQWVIVAGALAHMNCYYAFFGTVFTLGLGLLAINQALAWSKLLSQLYVWIVSCLLAIASLATDKYNYYISLDQQLSHLKWRAIDRLTQTEDFKALKAESVIYSPTLFALRGIVANFSHYWTDYLSERTRKKVFVSQTLADFFAKQREHPQSEFYFLSFYQEPKDANHFIVLAKAPYMPYPESDVVYSTEAILFTYSKYRGFVVIGKYRPDKSVEIRVDGLAVGQVSGGLFAQKVNKNDWPDDLPRTAITSTTPIDVAHVIISYFPIMPQLDDFNITYGQGFYGLEKNEAAHTYWSWSANDSEMSAWNHSAQSVHTCLKLQFMTFSAPRTVTITSGVNRQSVKLESGVHLTPTTISLSLAPGQNKIFFHTDRPAQLVGNGDPREIAFGIQNAAMCDLVPGPP